MNFCWIFQTIWFFTGFFKKADGKSYVYVLPDFNYHIFQIYYRIFPKYDEFLMNFLKHLRVFIEFLKHLWVFIDFFKIIYEFYFGCFKNTIGFFKKSKFLLDFSNILPKFLKKYHFSIFLEKFNSVNLFCLSKMN